MENEDDILSKIPLDMPAGPYLLGYTQAVSDLNKDWDTFRREAAKDILCSMIVVNCPDRFGGTLTKVAVEWADELIKQLQEGKE